MSTPSSSTPTLSRPLRLFLALWPGPAVREALRQRQSAWRWTDTARRVPPDRLHLTLHFLGDVPDDRLPLLLPGLRVECSAFVLTLTSARLWPQGVAVLQPAVTPPALQALHAALRRALAALDLPVESRPFRPHVTLARRAGGSLPPDAMAPLRWRVRGYALVASEGGPRPGYRRLARYPAGATA